VPYFEWEKLRSPQEKQAYMTSVISSMAVEEKLQGQLARDAGGDEVAVYHALAGKRQFILGNEKYLQRVRHFLHDCGHDTSSENVNLTALRLALHTVSADWVKWGSAHKEDPPKQGPPGSA